jgi:hypothetical protein
MVLVQWIGGKEERKKKKNIPTKILGNAVLAWMPENLK